MNARAKKSRSSSARGGRGKVMERQPSAEGVYSNHRFMQAVGALVGLPVQVLTKTKEVFEGVLTTFSANFDLVLDLPHTVSCAEASLISNPESIKRKMIFAAQDIVVIKVTNVDMDYASRETFAIDSQISKYNGRVQEKELEPWHGAETAVASDVGLGDESANGWDADDMFKKNEEKYGVTTTYSPEMEGYTTALQKKNTKEYKDQEAKAQKIAQEIEHSPVAQTRAQLENGDEEERFSAVIRPDQGTTTVSSSSVKYMPPQRRKNQSSANKQPPRGTPSPQSGGSAGVGGGGIASVNSGRYNNNNNNNNHNSSPPTSYPPPPQCSPITPSPMTSPTNPSSSYATQPKLEQQRQPQPSQQYTPKPSQPPPPLSQPSIESSKINEDNKDNRRHNDYYVRENKSENYHQELNHGPHHHQHHQHHNQMYQHNQPYHLSSESRRSEPREQREPRKPRNHKDEQCAELKKFGQDFTLSESVDKKSVQNQMVHQQNLSAPPPQQQGPPPQQQGPPPQQQGPPPPQQQGLSTPHQQNQYQTSQHNSIQHQSSHQPSQIQQGPPHQQNQHSGHSQQQTQYQHPPQTHPQPQNLHHQNQHQTQHQVQHQPVQHTNSSNIAPVNKHSTHPVTSSANQVSTQQPPPSLPAQASHSQSVAQSELQHVDASPASQPASTISQEVKEEDKVSSAVSNSKLNPNAKEFVFNPKPFSPRSPNATTPPRVHTPQIPLTQPPQMGGGAGGMQPVSFHQNMVHAFVMAPQPFSVQQPQRYTKRVPVGNQRPDYASSMQVAAATGPPIMAPASLPPMTATQSLSAVQLQQNMMAQTAQPFQYQMMYRFPSPGIPMVTTMVPTSMGMYHQGDAHQTSQGHNHHLYLGPTPTAVTPHQPHPSVTPGPHPGQPPTPQGHNGGPNPMSNIPTQPPTPGPTPPQAMMYGGPAGVPMGGQPTIPQHIPQHSPHTAQSPHSQYPGNHNAALAAAAAASASHQGPATQLVMLQPHMAHHVMPPGGPPHSATGHIPSSIAGYAPSSSGAMQPMNHGSQLHYIPAGAPGGQGNLPVVHRTL